MANSDPAFALVHGLLRSMEVTLKAGWLRLPDAMGDDVRILFRLVFLLPPSTRSHHPCCLPQPRTLQILAGSCFFTEMSADGAFNPVVPVGMSPPEFAKDEEQRRTCVLVRPPFKWISMMVWNAAETDELLFHAPLWAVYTRPSIPYPSFVVVQNGVVMNPLPFERSLIVCVAQGVTEMDVALTLVNNPDVRGRLSMCQNVENASLLLFLHHALNSDHPTFRDLLAPMSPLVDAIQGGTPLESVVQTRAAHQDAAAAMLAMSRMGTEESDLDGAALALFGNRLDTYATGMPVNVDWKDSTHRGFLKALQTHTVTVSFPETQDWFAHEHTCPLTDVKPAVGFFAPSSVGPAVQRLDSNSKLDVDARLRVSVGCDLVWPNGESESESFWSALEISTAAFFGPASTMRDLVSTKAEPSVTPAEFGSAVVQACADCFSLDLVIVYHACHSTCTTFKCCNNSIAAVLMSHDTVTRQFTGVRHHAAAASSSSF